MTTANTTQANQHPPEIQAIYDTFTAQKTEHQNNPLLSAHERIERLTRLRRALMKHIDAFCEAISQDFGNRAYTETKMGEILTVINHIDVTIKHIPKWMKPSARKISLTQQPSKGWIEYQPLGVIGIMAPWNYPLLLSVGPLISALAAGNNAMLKISSSSPKFGEVLKMAFAEVFPENQVAVVNGGGVISDVFCALPFDLIVFTGSSAIGKTVMSAAAQNLTPVILELGGKSPVIVHESADLAEVAERLTFGKFWNAGQTCVAPDYAFIPRGKTKSFISHMKIELAKRYPTLLNNPDFTSIVNDKQHRRIEGYLADAKNKGAEIDVYNPANEDFSDTRKIPPTFVSNLDPEMTICKEEIFGPVLIIHEYDAVQDALNYINARPHPLAFYYFDHDEKRAKHIFDHTKSGHFGINAVITHVTQDDLPFGGIGNSGMGKYHGREGFLAMSHGRSIMATPKFYSVQFLLPPFGTKIHKIMEKTLLR